MLDIYRADLSCAGIEDARLNVEVACLFDEMIGSLVAAHTGRLNVIGTDLSSVVESTEDAVRTALARPRKAPSYFAHWRSLLELHNPPLPPATIAKLSASPIELCRRPIDEVFSRFLSIRDMIGEPLLLREVSSRIFWGLSKILDGRGDAVAALLELDECPFPSSPSS